MIEMKKVEKELEALEELIDLQVKKGAELLQAYEGKLYPLDFLAAAVLNRSIELIKGFSLLVKEDNYLVAASLVRLQIDNLLRLSAVWLVSDTQDFAKKVMAGTPIRKLKDRNGERMRDSYLLQRIGEKNDWIRSVYEETSGFIHLSDKHILSLFNRMGKDRNVVKGRLDFEMVIGGTGENIPDSLKIEMVQAYSEITKGILTLIQDLIVAKQTPDSLKTT